MKVQTSGRTCCYMKHSMEWLNHTRILTETKEQGNKFLCGECYYPISKLINIWAYKKDVVDN